ncbi:hypothetical protein J7I84_00375 [Arthrobacter sp. ISL-85]|uniref:hypothetical protein n=1 Tax=Arthrobacter sp. ISL-85 TaxID=2819115 RepID=UPI001BE4E9B4|nr:hypothetical protein [Arthrobacter sp. ISL-85]MBT2564964.1 hypothetical protein [Arthrobacter sp. ISL-85]
MKSKLTVWAFLRPLLLALAATASWIALSAGGASADASGPSEPLLGAAPSVLGSATTSVTHQAADIPAPVKAGPSGGPVTAVAAVVAPAVSTVDGVISGTVGTVVPVAGAVLGPLSPVLEPVVSAAPSPVPVAPAAPAPGTAAPPQPAVADVPQVEDAAPARTAGLEVANPGAAPAPAIPLHDARPLHDMLHNHGTACAPQMKQAALVPLPAGTDAHNPPFPRPSDPLSGMPGATGGSCVSGGNGPAMPAWIGAQNLQIPATGAATIRGGLPAAPAPVSFGPGSSPD